MDRTQLKASRLSCNLPEDKAVSPLCRVAISVADGASLVALFCINPGVMTMGYAMGCAGKEWRSENLNPKELWVAAGFTITGAVVAVGAAALSLDPSNAALFLFGSFGGWVGINTFGVYEAARAIPAIRENGLAAGRPFLDRLKMSNWGKSPK